MSFILDTGSAWTWLPNLKCPLDQCSGERYLSEQSETFKTLTPSKPGDKIPVTEIKYATGNVAGYVSKDTFSLSKEPPSD
jgi:hypothetical protein